MVGFAWSMELDAEGVLLAVGLSSWEGGADWGCKPGLVVVSEGEELCDPVVVAAFASCCATRCRASVR